MRYSKMKITMITHCSLRKLRPNSSFFAAYLNLQKFYEDLNTFLLTDMSDVCCGSQILVYILLKKVNTRVWRTAGGDGLCGSSTPNIPGHKLPKNNDIAFITLLPWTTTLFRCFIEACTKPWKSPSPPHKLCAFRFLTTTDAERRRNAGVTNPLTY